MARIRILSDRLASQIAAGEVVERPATVVKELFENSLDAGARAIDVELEAGGKRRIVVSDDGEGMDADDALLAFDRHATSKIREFDDLERVATFGFRGEALASIAAVARVELTTAREAGEGTRVRIEGGRVRSVEPAARPRGTRIEIASLFYNVPARRKFLKTPATELRHASAVVQAYALALPALTASLRHDGKALLEAQALADDRDSVRERVRQIFGDRLGDGLTPVPSRRIPGGGEVWGYLGGPGSGGARRAFTFVNRRSIRDRAVMATFYRAVREEWHSEEFPALFLFVDLPPEAVDVNVHPQKTEVRFRDRAVLSQVASALREGLAASRGEIEATPAGFEGVLTGPAVWRGSGAGAPVPSPAGVGAGERTGEAVAEGHRLAEAVYAPLERSAVPLSGRSGEARPFRLLGQYKGTLLLLEGPDGLYLIDQHVAHERILFERIRRSMSAEAPRVQALLQPMVLDLAPSESLKLAEQFEALGRCGFDLNHLSGDSLALAGAPAGLPVSEAEGVLRRLAASTHDLDDPEEMRSAILESWAADASCKAAVKMHEPLSAPEMEALVRELFEAEQPYACPHGRPIVLRMTDRDLETKFGRR